MVKSIQQINFILLKLQPNQTTSQQINCIFHIPNNQSTNQYNFSYSPNQIKQPINKSFYFFLPPNNIKQPINFSSQPQSKDQIPNQVHSIPKQIKSPRVRIREATKSFKKQAWAIMHKSAFHQCISSAVVLLLLFMFSCCFCMFT